MRCILPAKGEHCQGHHMLDSLALAKAQGVAQGYHTTPWWCRSTELRCGQYCGCCSRYSFSARSRPAAWPSSSRVRK